MATAMVSGGCGKLHPAGLCGVCLSVQKRALKAAVEARNAQPVASAKTVKNTRVHLAQGADSSHLEWDGVKLGKLYTYRLCRRSDHVFSAKAALRMGAQPGNYLPTCVNCSGRFGAHKLADPAFVAAARAEIERENATGAPLTAAEQAAGVVRMVAAVAPAPTPAPAANGAASPAAVKPAVDQLAAKFAELLEMARGLGLEIPGLVVEQHVHDWHAQEWRCTDCGEITRDRTEAGCTDCGPESDLSEAMADEVVDQARKIVDGSAVPDTSDSKLERKAAKVNARGEVYRMLLKRHGGDDAAARKDPDWKASAHLGRYAAKA